MLIRYLGQNNLKTNALVECIQNFQNELITEARILDVQKTPVKMSQNDISFLHQFEPRWWKQAIIKRFDLLYQALKEREEIRKKYYDKLYQSQLEYAIKEFSYTPTLRFVSKDIKNALIKQTAHRQTMEKIARLADKKFWEGEGQKYDKDMEFKFEGAGGKQIIYDANPYLKSLVETIEGQVGQKGGLDLSNPHEVQIEKGKIKRKTTGFEFPEEETINQMQKKWLIGLANGLLGEKKLEDFDKHVLKDKEGNISSKTIIHHPASKVFDNQKMKIDDTFAFDHEQKRIFKSLRKIFNSYKSAYNDTEKNDEKALLLKNLIQRIKSELPFTSNLVSGETYDDALKFFHDVTLSSKDKIFQNIFKTQDEKSRNNLKSPSIGIPDEFFGKESVFNTLLNYLAAKQLVEWAKQGNLKNSNNELIQYDSTTDNLIFPELKVPTFSKKLNYRIKQQAKKGGGFENVSVDVKMPALAEGGFVKEHDEENPQHKEEHGGLPRRGMLYNPKTGKMEHRFVNVDSLPNAGHQGTEHDRIGSYNPTQNIAGVDFLDIRDPEIRNKLEQLVREEGLCTYTISIQNNKTVIDIKDASHTDKNTVLCGIAKSIVDYLGGSATIDKRKITPEKENALNHFPMIYKIVLLNILNNLGSDRIKYQNQRRQYVSQLVYDILQKNLAGKGTRRVRGEEREIETKTKPESKNLLLNLINTLKSNLLQSCDVRNKTGCSPCNPEDYTCEIKASFPIEKVIQKAQEIDDKIDTAEKTLKPSHVEKNIEETETIEKMLVALIVSKEIEKNPEDKNLKNINTKIEDTAKEIKNIFVNEKNKNISLVDSVKSILKRMGLIS